MTTFDTPVNRSEWEPEDLDLANRYSGLDLALPDGTVVPLSNREAALRAAEEAEYAADLANEVLDSLDLTDAYSPRGQTLRAAEHEAEAGLDNVLAEMDRAVAKAHPDDADLLARWDGESRR